MCIRDRVTGVVDKISLVDNEYRVHIGDKSFSLEQIMELGESPSTEPDDSVDYDQSAFLLSLVGKQVTIKDDDEEEITGTVSRISLQDGMKLMVGDKWYTLDQLVSVDQIEQETPCLLYTSSGAQAFGLLWYNKNQFPWNILHFAGPLWNLCGF